MPDVAITIEAQFGLTWERWERIARSVEEFGFDGLFRSDHFTNPEWAGGFLDSLELWTSLTWLADNTERIEFGSLVSPVSFRHPVFTARMAKDVDDLAGGRLVLGVGAGWQELEHRSFGFDLLDLPDRFDRFEEGVTVIDALLRSDEPVSFDGEYYQLNDALLLPRPERSGGPPLLIGGNGPDRTLPLAAKYASEWNGINLTPDRFKELNTRLDRLLKEEGRPLTDVRRSVMIRPVYGRDETELDRRLEDEPFPPDLDSEGPQELREHGYFVGTGSEIAEQLDRLDRAGVERVIFQWFDFDHEGNDRLEALAKAVL